MKFILLTWTHCGRCGRGWTFSWLRPKNFKKKLDYEKTRENSIVPPTVSSCIGSGSFSGWRSWHRWRFASRWRRRWRRCRCCFSCNCLHGWTTSLRNGFFLAFFVEVKTDLVLRIQKRNMISKKKTSIWIHDFFGNSTIRNFLCGLGISEDSKWGCSLLGRIYWN